MAQVRIVADEYLNLLQTCLSHMQANYKDKEYKIPLVDLCIYTRKRDSNGRIKNLIDHSDSIEKLVTQLAKIWNENLKGTTTAEYCAMLKKAPNDHLLMRTVGYLLQQSLPILQTRGIILSVRLPRADDFNQLRAFPFGNKWGEPQILLPLDICKKFKDFVKKDAPALVAPSLFAPVRHNVPAMENKNENEGVVFNRITFDEAEEQIKANGGADLVNNFRWLLRESTEAGYFSITFVNKDHDFGHGRFVLLRNADNTVTWKDVSNNRTTLENLRKIKDYETAINIQEELKQLENKKQELKTFVDNILEGLFTLLSILGLQRNTIIFAPEGKQCKGTEKVNRVRYMVRATANEPAGSTAAVDAPPGYDESLNDLPPPPYDASMSAAMGAGAGPGAGR